MPYGTYSNGATPELQRLPSVQDVHRMCVAPGGSTLVQERVLSLTRQNSLAAAVHVECLVTSRVQSADYGTITEP